MSENESSGEVWQENFAGDFHHKISPRF